MVNINQKSSCKFCSQKCDSFKRLTTNELSHVNEHRFQTKFKKGDVIFRQHTPASNIISISSGLVKLSIEGLNERDLILDFLKGPVLICEPGLYVDHRYHTTLTAVTHTEACVIETDSFKQVMHQNTNFTDQYIYDFSTSLLKTQKRIISLTQKHINGRMAEVILYFSQDIYKSLTFDISISRQELADYTCITKESVSRILKQFREDELIEYKHNSFKVLDLKRLQITSENG